MHISITMSDTSKDSGYQDNTECDSEHVFGELHQLDNVTKQSFRRSSSRDEPSPDLMGETTDSNIELHTGSHEFDNDDRSSVSSVELVNTFSNMPINHVDNDNDIIDDNVSITDAPRYMAVPTPVNLNMRDIIEPLEEWSRVQGNIRERKYPVLPKIGKRSKESSKRKKQFEAVNYNQLDYTRDKMETEADFFSDYRLNTSCVKETPKHNPLPPIGHSPSMGSLHSKR